MSDQEMTVAQELKQLMDAQVAEKADKADLEGLVKEDAIEGFVKEEQVAEQIKSAVDAAKEEQRQEFEEKLQSISVITSQKSDKGSSMEFKSGLQVSNGGDFGLDIPTFKAYDDTTNVQGSSVGSDGLFYTLEQMNPFRGMATVMPVTSGSFNIPKSAGITVSSRSSVPSSRTHEGDLSSTAVVIETWDGTAEYSIEALDDLPGLDGVVARQAAQAVGKAEREDAISVLNAASGIESLTSGAAGALPSKANVIGVMAELMTGVDIAYRNNAAGMFVVDSSLEARLREANDNAYAFDPAMGMNRLFGYPVMTVNGLNDGTISDGDHVAYFGDFSSGLILATRESMSVRRSDEQKLGSIVYYTRSRFKNAIWDADALSTLVVGA